MSFRRRMVLLAASAVAAAIVIASIVVYIVTRNELSGQLDASLRAKITPGRQFLKIETHLSQDERTQLTREGKLQALLAAVPSGFGMIAKASGAIPAPGGIGETAPAPASGSQGHAEGKSGVNEAAPAHTSAGPAKSLTTGVAPAQEGSSSARAGGGVAQEAFTIERHLHVPRAAVRIPEGQVRLVLKGAAVEGPTGYAQLSLADGEVLVSTSGSPQLPITAATRGVASGRRNAFFSDVAVHGTPVRVLTARAAEGAAWQVALPLADLHSTLDHLRLVLAIVVLGGIALAAALGLLVSRAALVPVRRLTGAAERV
ncbi:MAG TPA: hypothetical protein VMF09_17125, partial [Solirubrobacteraceae bacterium]|nr:hypothetical protein [Solirubrobacteraceae bacterium]